MTDGQNEPSITSSACSRAFNNQDYSPISREITLIIEQEDKEEEDTSQYSKSGQLDIQNLMDHIFQDSSNQIDESK
jgi:hypothetical protein